MAVPTRLKSNTPGHNLWAKLICIWLLLSLACRLPGGLSPAAPAGTQSVDTQGAGTQRPGEKSLPQQTASTPGAAPTQAIQVPPAVVETRPLAGAQIGAQEKITFFFNEPMDRDSVEKAFVFPAGTPFQIAWKDDTTVSIQPSTPLPPDTSLSLTIDSSARAANGMSLLEPYDAVFQTGGLLKVTQFLPADASQEILPGAAISVSFNQPVVPLTGSPAEGPAAFTLDPPTGGKGRWLNTSTYLFVPTPALAGGQAYTATLNPQLTALNGFPLDEAAARTRWSFETGLPWVMAMTPDGKEAIALDQAFTLQFSQPMDAASVDAGLRLLDPAQNPVTVKREWNQNYTEVTLTPATPLARATPYTFSLAPEVKAAGGTPLGKGLNQTYTTIGALALKSSNPAAGQALQLNGGYGYVVLQFNAPLARQTYKNLVSVEPAVTGLNVYPVGNQGELNLTAYFDPDTSYQIKISPDLSDRYGGKMAAPAVLPLTTQPAQPELVIPSLMTGWPAVFFLPDDVQISVNAINLYSLRVTSGKLTLADFIRSSSSYRSEMKPNPTAVSAWDQPLKLTPNRSQSVEVPLSNYGSSLEPGLYAFNLRSPELGKTQPYPFLGVVSSTQILMKRSAEEVFLWVVGLPDLKPVSGKAISLFSSQNVAIGTGTTDADGLARISLPSTFDRDNRIYAVIDQPGDPDFAIGTDYWSSGIMGWNFGIPVDLNSTGPRVYLYTDRPIYQPGQTIYFRAILRQAENGRYKPLDLPKTTLTLRGDYSEETGEQPVLASLDLPLSDYGTVSGSFPLPEDSQPGQYTLSIDAVENAQIGVKVAEYRKPQIDLQVKIDSEEVLASSGFDARIQADYYFGAPAANQKLIWNVRAVPADLYIPGGYQTGRSAADWIEQNGMEPIDSAFVMEQNAVTGPDGGLTVHISPDDLAERIDLTRGQRLILEATLTGPDNSPVSARTSILLHPAKFYVGLRRDAWENQAGSEAGFSVQTVDLKGDPSGSHSLEARFDKISWEEDPTSTTPFFYGIRRVPRYTPVSSTNLATDGQGRARIAFTPAEPGLYLLAVQGEGADTRIPVWVGGAGSAQWPTLPDQHLTLVSDSTQYQAGQTAKILIPNPFPSGARALVSVERGRVMRAQVIEINAPSLSYPIDLGEADAPNVYVSVTLLGQNQEKLDFRQGYLNLKVNPAAELLAVEMTPHPARSGPGGKVDFNIRVRDAAGNPVQGEFSLALVDKAVLALASPNADPIDAAFYSDQDLGVVTSLPLAVYNRRTNTTQPGGRGGGSSELPAQVRTQFADTAFWNGSIVTNADGMATVTVTLPDNLTTWVATVRGLDQDTRVGEATGEVIAARDLLVQPVTPRFLVAGDYVQLAAVIHNNTTQDLDPDVSLLASGAILDGTTDPDTPAIQRIHLPAGTNQRVTWWATVQTIDQVHLVFSAQAGSLQDSTTPEAGDLPVLRYSVPMTVGTDGMLSEEGSRREVIAAPSAGSSTLGDLTVELSPSLASTILSGLDALDQFSGDDPELLLSRFLPNLETYRVLKDLGLEQPTLKSRLDQNIKTSVAKLSATQNPDGGWSWSPGLNSDTYLSSYIFFGLSQAYNAGVIVNQKVLEQARDYLKNNLPALETLTEGWQYDRAVYQYFVLAHSSMARLDNPALYDQRDRLSPWARALLALYIRDLYPDDPRPRSLIADLGASAIRSSTGAHWESSQPNSRNLNTANFTTAVVVYAMAQIDPAQPLTTEAVRYLVLNRQSRGVWASSYETSWVLLALNVALQGTADLQAGYEYSAVLNDQRIAAGAAKGAGSLTPILVTVPASDLQNAAGNVLTVSRGAGSGRLSYRAFLQVYQPAETAQPIDHGLALQRTYTLPGQDCQKTACTPLDSVDLGQNDTLVVRLTLTLPHDMISLVVDDPIPAGTEIIDPTLLTTPQSEEEPVDLYDPLDPFSNGWGWWLFGRPQIYDERIRWTAADVPAGTYVLTYRLRLLQPGQFRVLPPQAYERYFPDVYGTGAGQILEIKSSEP